MMYAMFRQQIEKKINHVSLKHFHYLISGSRPVSGKPSSSESRPVSGRVTASESGDQGNKLLLPLVCIYVCYVCKD